MVQTESKGEWRRFGGDKTSYGRSFMDKTIKCPNCGEAFDNVENEFLECSHCGKKYKNPFYKHEDVLEQESQHEQAAQETQPAQSEPETHNDSVGAVFVNQQQTAHTEEVHEEHAQKAQNDAFKFDLEQADTKVEKSEPSKKENKENASQNRGSDAFMRVITNTIKEFFKFEQFKRIPVGLAVVAGILLSPFLLSVIFMIPAFYILQFCYKIVAAPADFLLQNLREESDNTVVKAVVYFVGYPFVFLMKIALSVFSVEFFVMYFFFMLFAWIYGCGGIKFQPFIFEASTDCSAHLEGKASKKTVAIILTVCILIGVFIFSLALGVGIANADFGGGSGGGGGYNGGGSNNSYNNSLNDSFYMSSYDSDQKTFYFTPSSSGYYTLRISDNDNNANIYVYVNGSMKLSTSSYSDSTSMYMSSGSSYTISVSYVNNSYSDRVDISISK